MTVKVGMPRALLYYKYYPIWDKFFKLLGAEVVVSPETNRRILTQSIKVAESEFCLPVKVFYGHVLSLKDKVDAIFVPRLVSVEKKAFICPKFLGLPDMIRAIDMDLPRIISPTINMNLGRRQFYATINEVGSQFTKSKFKMMKAYLQAFRGQSLLSSKLTGKSKRVVSKNNQTNKSVRIGVVGHDYNILDSYVSMNLLERLRNLGVNVITCHDLSPKMVGKEAHSLPKRLFWSDEKEIVGAAFHWLKYKAVDGIIYVLAFACGPDSLIQTLLEHEAKKLAAVPLMSLVLDEHSAEAGLVTRLEAFVDMLKRKGAVT